MTSRSEDDWLEDVLAGFRTAAASRRLGLGIGDDAASVLVDGGEVVVATDVLVDGVHFELGACGPRAAARKALAVNVSDLAACGARPLAFVVGGVLPRPVDRGLFDALMDGFARAADELDCVCAGGDTNAAAGPLVLAVTVLGRPGPWGLIARSGAVPGDVLSVTGPLGGSLASGRHLTFAPRVAWSEVLCRLGVPRAMMDISDGLGRDLPRLCAASGVGAEIEARLVPIHPDVAGADDPTGRALGDGEDFELLVAHPPLDAAVESELAEAGVVLTRIGRATPAAAGLRWLDDTGDHPFPETGYDHLRPH